MNRPSLLLALFPLAGVAYAQMPWPMERHDRWGSGTAHTGPSSASLTTPWGFARLSNTVPVTHGPAIVSKTLGYYGDWINNRVYRFNPSTGQVYNFFQAGNFVQSTPAIAPNGQVFVTTNSGGTPPGRLFAIDPVNMTFNWFQDTFSAGFDDFHAASATIGPDGDIVMPSTTGSVFRMHPTGSAAWTKTGLQNAHCTIVFSRDDSKIFVSNGNAMTALNYVDGSIAWSKDYGAQVGAPGVAPNGALFFGTKAGWIYRVNPATGDTVWSKQLLGEVHYAPAFTPGGNTAYFVANDGRLYAYRVADGVRNWYYTQSTYPITNAPIVGTDGRVYLFNRVGDLDSVSGSGLQIWHVHMPHDGYGRGTMTIGPDGSLYVGFVSDIRPRHHSPAADSELVHNPRSGPRKNSVWRPV